MFATDHLNSACLPPGLVTCLLSLNQGWKLIMQSAGILLPPAPFIAMSIRPAPGYYTTSKVRLADM
jgi:hypothetical protein